MLGPHSAPCEPALLLSVPAGGWQWLDALGIAIVLVGAVLGALRGLWWQVIRLIGVTGAVLAARSLAPELEPTITSHLPALAGRVAHGLAWLVCFLAGLSLAALLGLIGKGALEVLQLGLIDRAGGLCAGAATGVLAHGVVLVALAQLASAPWVTAHVTGTRGAQVLRALAQEVPLFLEAEPAARLRRTLEASAAERPPSTDAREPGDA